MQRVTLWKMNRRTTAATAMTALLGFAVAVGASLATAQTGGTVVIDFSASDDAGLSGNADSTDAGFRPDGGNAAPEPRIEIDRINDAVPTASAPVPPPRNDRSAIVAQLGNHVTRCIATRTPEPGAANTRFNFLVREGFAHAKLTAVINPEPMYVDWLHISVLRAVGDTRALDVRTEHTMFRECIEVVPLESPPHVTERVSFLVKAHAGQLLVREVEWGDL